VVTALVRTGIRAEAAAQIRTVEWSKYALFMSWMAPAVLTRLETYRFLTYPDTAAIVAQLLQETSRLAARLGVTLEDRGPLPVQTLFSMPLAEAVAPIRRLGDVMEAQAPVQQLA